MVVAELVEWIAGSSAGQLGIAIGLIAVVLYWRKATKAGSIVGSIGGRVAFAAATVGVLLLLGVITGLDVELATRLATQTYSWLVELANELWEVVVSWR